MATGMPELGSKISLISKADIRYEGRLFTVDPAECTIALAGVRSYGTEDRETQFPISPQNQVYDYILFRGSDIKDIRVVNNVPMPNDPAIMQMHLPTTQVGQPQLFQPQGFPVAGMGHNVMGAAGMNQYGPNSYTSMAGLSGLTGNNLAPGGSMSTTGLNKSKQATSVLDLIGGGSRSTTPVSSVSRKSPTAEMGIQVNQQGGSKDGQRRNNQGNRAHRDRRDSAKIDHQNQMGHDNRNQLRTNSQQQQHQHSQQQQQQQVSQQFHANNQNRGWAQRGANNNLRGNRPRGRGPPMQQVFRQNLHNQNNKGRPKTTIKFESDYDFEQANNKFEELRLELAKLKVGEEATKPEQVNGEADKKDDSGNETGAGEHEQEEDDATIGYDKTKSFFDNISCEAATDRTQGKNRTDWRHERKINSETFGVSSARRGGYYNYRGRGGYFNRNMNMGGGYRGNGGYRGGNMGGGNNGNGGPGSNFRGARNYNNRNYGQSAGNGIPTPINKPEQPPSASASRATPVTAGN